MDLTRYINKLNGKIEIVLGKISDISNQYLVLSYRYSEKKSASGKYYDVYDMTSSNRFFSDSDLKIMGSSEIIETFKGIYQGDLIGSIVRYEYDKYLCVGIWLNTYAQLNIPSPIFYNVENIMNDIRMMYFGKQSEDEIIGSIRKNWYDSKYQNDLKIPLIDISKKFTDDFVIIQEAKDIDKFRDLIIGAKEEKKAEAPVGDFSNNFTSVKFSRNAKEDFSLKPYNLFLWKREAYVYYDYKNNCETINDSDYHLVMVNEGDYMKGALKFSLPLITKKEELIYQNYELEASAEYKTLFAGYFFKAGDFIREDLKFSTNEKYEYGTIIEFKAKYVIIGKYYDAENDKLVYMSVNINLWDKDKVTNKAFQKLIKKWSESEIDDLAKKKKVFIKEPLKSSYSPKEYLSGDISLASPFQQQTMAKLTGDLDLIRDKNVVLYDAFINVINAINKKIESKVVKPKQSKQTDLYGIRLRSSTAFMEYQQNILDEALNLGEIDNFIYNRISNSKDVGRIETKYFTNTDDLMKYSAKILNVFTSLFVKYYKDLQRETRMSYLTITFDNLPLFNQELKFSFRPSTNSFVLLLDGYNQISFSSYSDFEKINFLNERKEDFFLNIIRLRLNVSYIQRLKFESVLVFKETDAWKKSLLMLNPYFTFDTELLKTISCSAIRYGLSGLESYKYSPFYWINDLKYKSIWDMPEDTRNAIFERNQYFDIWRLNGGGNENAFKDFIKKYDQVSLDVYEGAPLPKSPVETIPVETETEDFLQELDSMDFSDESLFVDAILDEVDNLDFDDPDLFN